MLACSQESRSPVAKGYHNTTAYYNAYFLAEERLTEVENKLWDQQKYDYNRILPVTPQFDTTASSGMEEDLNYVGEKATYPIKLHKNSQWVDDCQILIGRARHYQSKPDYADQMLKYVVSSSEDKDAKHEALAWLLHSKVHQRDMTDAYQLISLLQQEEDAEKLKPKSGKQFHLASAEFHRSQEEFSQMLPHVKKAIPLEKDNKRRSHLNFVAGQLEQLLGHDSASYAHYKKALKNNPPYELEFYTKLSMAQVSEITDAQENKRIRKYFDKLLVDLKNQEFKDRIYYEMARFELKQGNTEAALDNLNKSLHVEGARDLQKAYSYRLAGEIYYDKRDYRKAERYYDSTVALYNQDHSEFEEINDRKLTLTEFVEQITIIETEDSLQRMAKMTPDDLDALIEKAAKAKEEEIKRERERQKLLEQKEKEKEQQSPLLAGGGTNFVFYNPSALGQSRIQFLNVWGDRPLEDNWRRALKQTDATEDAEKLEQPKDTVQVAVEDEPKEEEIHVDRQQYYDAIPKTEEDFAASNERLEDALFKAGKLYTFKLNEPEYAIETFMRHKTEFPESDDRAEALYLLCLLCEKSTSCSPDEHSPELLSKYPNSIYAKLYQNPNYRKEYKTDNEEAESEYARAYELYRQGDYLGARREIDQILQTYPLAEVKDRLTLLKVLTYARTDQALNYQNGLEKFMVDFKTSELVPYADSLLAQHKSLMEEEGISVSQLSGEYASNDSTQHYVMGIFKSSEIKPDNALPVFYEFNENYFRNKGYNTKAVSYDEQNFLVRIGNFENKKEAEEYLEKLKHYHDFGKHFEGLDYSYYVITFDNYNLLLNKRDLTGYQIFSGKQ